MPDPIPTDRELVRAALYDAIDWQRTLADAYSHVKTDPAYLEAKEQVKLCKRLLRKRYNEDKKPLDRLLDRAALVDIETISEASK